MKIIIQSDISVFLSLDKSNTYIANVENGIFTFHNIPKGFLKFHYENNSFFI